MRKMYPLKIELRPDHRQDSESEGVKGDLVSLLLLSNYDNDDDNNNSNEIPSGKSCGGNKCECVFLFLSSHSKRYNY